MGDLYRLDIKIKKIILMCVKNKVYFDVKIYSEIISF